MKVEIKDLGYVKNIKLDLDKNLTILCGPNNTGKTYVAYAIYGLMRFRSDISKSQKISDQVKNIITKGQIELDIVEFLKEHSSLYLDTIGKNYVKQLSKVFASDDSSFEKTTLHIEIGDIENLRSKIFAQKINQEIGIRNSISITIRKDINSSILTCILIENESNPKQEIPTSILLDFIANRIFNLLIDFIFPNTYIAPAERIAINIFSKELSLKRVVLVDKLLELKEEGKDDDIFDYARRRATRYPSPIRDSLEISEDLNNYKKNKSEFEEFANEIEKDILKGQVLISKDGDVQFKPEKAKSLRLPIHLTASVVKSLSNLVIYFRHLAIAGDFIIIDEPELNLHPDNQVIIARVLAKIANKGFKLLISTHSDYIIREINNLIMLKNNPKLANKYKYDTNTLLSYQQIGAILFHYNTKKCINLEVNDTGFEIETIDEVINELNERSQNLFFNSEIE